jgi:predicted DNA-binding transcriptional regulator AlpA
MDGRRKKQNEGSINMSTQFLTEVEVAQRTHISLATLRRWRLENRGPIFRKFGSLVRYAEEELARWEQAQPSGGENIAERFMPQPARSIEPVARSR